MASNGTVDAECEVTICFHWELVGVEHEEHAPKLPASVTSESTESDVESNAGSVTHLSKRPRH